MGVALHVRDGHRIDGSAHGALGWHVARRAVPVVFLTCPMTGLADGDRSDTLLCVEGSGSVVATTQGVTALLAAETPSTQTVRLRVSGGAHLTYLPRPAVPYAGSRSVLETAAEVDPGASLIAWDTLAVGRAGMGERLDLASLRSGWTLTRGGATILRDRLRLDGEDRLLADAMLAGRTHVGSLVIVGPDDAALGVDEARSCLGERLDLVGVSRPAAGLLVARALDDRSERIEAAFLRVVNSARRALGLTTIAAGDIGRRHLGGP
jgi:urease accessory protein